MSSSQRFPGTGHRLGGPPPPRLPTPAKVPLPPTPARTPSPPSRPMVAATVTDSSTGAVFDSGSGGKLDLHYGAQLVVDEDRVESLGNMNVAVTDHSSHHRIFNKGGKINTHHGPQVDLLDGTFTPTSSRSRSASSSSSHLSSDENASEHLAEYREVYGRRESPVVRGSSGRSKNERSSIVASVFAEDRTTPPEDIPRPGNPTSALRDSEDSLEDIMNQLRLKLGPNREEDEFHEPSPRTESSNPNEPTLTPPLQLRRISDIRQNQRGSVTSADEPVIPPRRSREDQVSITTTSSSPSPSRRSRSSSRSSRSSLSSRSDEEHDSDYEHEHDITHGPRTTSPIPLALDQPLRSTHESIPPSSPIPQPQPVVGTKEKAPSIKQGIPPKTEPQKKKKKEAGCCSACIIC